MAIPTSRIRSALLASTLHRDSLATPAPKLRPASSFGSPSGPWLPTNASIQNSFGCVLELAIAVVAKIPRRNTAWRERRRNAHSGDDSTHRHQPYLKTMTQRQTSRPRDPIPAAAPHAMTTRHSRTGDFWAFPRLVRAGTIPEFGQGRRERTKPA